MLHLGGSSFGERRRDLAERNMRILLERHPRYLEIVHDFIEADPLRSLRELAAAHYRILTERLPGVLHVVHGHGGGTEYHVRALTLASREAFRHYLLIAVGDQWQLEEHDDGAMRSYNFSRLPEESYQAFLAGICARFSIDLPASGAAAAPWALLVEDDEHARALLELRLRAAGFHCQSVATAEEALVQARRRRPSVILVDMLLGGSDGHDVLRVLRADPATAAIPVVMATMAANRQTSPSLGAVALDDLVAEVAKAARSA